MTDIARGHGAAFDGPVEPGRYYVPEDRIRARRERSLRQQLPWFLERADFAPVFDNSSETPRVVLAKKNGTITVDPAAPEEIKAAAEGGRE